MGVQKLSAPSVVSVSPISRPVARPAPESSAGTAQATLAKIEQTLATNLPPQMKLQLDVDKNTGTVIGRVVDKETGELVRQIPTEEMIALIARSAQVNALLNKKI